MFIYKTDVVFQEIPNEISLSFSICGCTNRCKGCHSEFLWNESNGEFHNLEDILKIINKYKSYITNILFLGGEHLLDELHIICDSIHIKYPNIKISWYCGNNDLKYLHDNKNYFDYIKIGSYEETLGGLNNKGTNQRLFEIINNNINDITHLFWKEKEV